MSGQQKKMYRSPSGKKKVKLHSEGKQKLFRNDFGNKKRPPYAYYAYPIKERNLNHD